MRLPQLSDRNKLKEKYKTYSRQCKMRKETKGAYRSIIRNKDVSIGKLCRKRMGCAFFPHPQSWQDHALGIDAYSRAVLINF